MSLVSDVLNSVKFLFTGEADGVIHPDAHEKDLEKARRDLLDAVAQACEDGAVTIEELTALRQIQKNLNLSDAELNDLKVSAVRSVIERITEDNVVTEDELQLLRELEKTLQFQAGQDGFLKAEMDRVLSMYQPSQQ